MYIENNMFYELIANAFDFVRAIKNLDIVL